MLKKLKIKDFALIEDLDLNLGDGMTALTGETGSGKSLVLDALASILGAKCNTMNIRTGAKKYQIEVHFDIKNNRDVLNWLSEKGIPSQGDLVLRKELNQEGKSRIQINEALAPTQLLKELGGLLAEVHRQGEQHSLLDKEKQLEFLDLYADTSHTKRDFKKIFSKYRSVKQKIADLEAKESDRNSRLELFRYQLEELKKLNIKEGEEDILLEEEKILLQGEKVSTNLSYIHDLLGGGELNVLSVFPRIAFALEKIQTIQPEYLSWKEEILEIHSSLKALHSRVLEESDDIFYSLERLETVQNRLDEMAKVKKKYGKEIEDLVEYQKNLETELDRLTESSTEISELSEKLSHLQKDVSEKASELSQKRKNAISQMEKEITQEFHQLGMKDSRLQIVMKWESSQDGEIEEGDRRFYITENGLDQVDFYFSANPGEKPRPLRKIGSGGEMSRVLLALKSLLGSRLPGRLLIFDEIDTGISGEVSVKVAEKLSGLSRTHQILLITHQQVIAAKSKNQIKVSKSVTAGRTLTWAEPVLGEQRAEELAKMIAGDRITKGALDHARELLRKEAI
jgi:DNA repair protein RecN (Recombination protein N)